MAAFTVWIAERITGPMEDGPSLMPWREHCTICQLWPLDPPAAKEAHRIARELRQMLSTPHGSGALVAVRPTVAGEPLWTQEMPDHYDLPPYSDHY